MISNRCRNINNHINHLTAFMHIDQCALTLYKGIVAGVSGSITLHGVPLWITA